MNLMIEKWIPTDYLPLELLLTADPSRERVENYITKGQCYLYKKSNEILGVYVLLPKDSEKIEIMNIAVRETHQGSGIGKTLIYDAIRNAANQGYKCLEVGTGNSSVNQLAFYQKCGFRIMSVEFDYFSKHYQEEIVENGIVCRDMIRLGMKL
ncbi:N-acetyltransferase [Oceanobacillus piezotolerans]|uniref:N-acetyltransferase n=1 Tax=Oceanobacillus piezotolerans TaxID=2448030 RepID=A0A498D495_9BACI|nr:GNAT family N-acetyltransferase [Oceanobacillus piezotolerans]RLL43695.1 N-acetyltransferase [Oceanobacillus piezotolerans]